jgi:hypothetical protein
MPKDTTNNKRTHFKRRSGPLPSDNAARRLPKADAGLSEDEIDRRAWATANKIAPAAIHARSNRGKSK